MIAEVIINSIAKQLNKIFDYKIPDEFINNINIGSRVFVPFGKKVEEGFVVKMKKDSEYATKFITRVEDNILSIDNIELAKLMSKRYFCNISDCIKLMLPPGDTTKNIANRIKEKKTRFVYLNKSDFEEDKKIRSEKQKRVLAFLSKNDGEDVKNLELITDTNNSVIKALESKGYIRIVEKETERNPFINKHIKKDSKLKLTKQQKDVFDKIDINKNKDYLIYGITGSRKNRNIFTVNRKGAKEWKKCNSFSSRNFAYSTNGR